VSVRSVLSLLGISSLYGHEHAPASRINSSNDMERALAVVLFPTHHVPELQLHDARPSPCNLLKGQPSPVHSISSIDIVSHDFSPDFSSIESHIKYSVSS